jgi:hypothetical protein
LLELWCQFDLRRLRTTHGGSFYQEVRFAQSDIVPLNYFFDHLRLTFGGVKLPKDLRRAVLVCTTKSNKELVFTCHSTSCTFCRFHKDKDRYAWALLQLSLEPVD